MKIIVSLVQFYSSPGKPIAMTSMSLNMLFSFHGTPASHYSSLAVNVGLAPRLGSGRAFSIALRSRFALKPNPESVRFAEIKLLRSKITDMDVAQRYMVVTGEKGVGKTCLLNTAISNTEKE
jgi:hypothetical protein